jgi:MFS transporter, DHA1 family, tetracycline resistance protein
MKQKHGFFASASPLLLVLLIDGMGLGLVFPIINGLIFDPRSGFLPASLLTATMQNLIYGAIVGIFMLCWFFGAAVLGDLSDKIGRKNALLICLFGAFLSYLLSAFAVVFHSLTLLIIGRVIAGFTSGSQPIAQAAIIDLSIEEHKTRNIGYILLALSIGFIVGPLFGGILSDSSIVSWFNFSIPFAFAALMSFLNIGLLWWLFEETFATRHATFAINPYLAITIFTSAFQDKEIRKLSIIFFIFIFGWSSFYSFIAMFLLKLYNFNPTQVSLYMATMGVGFGIGNGYLSNFFAKRFSLNANTIVSVFLTGIMVLLVATIHSELLCWIMIIPIASTVSITYTSILTMFSNQVSSEKQGWVMGVSASILAFVFGIDGILIGIIATWNDILPLSIAGLCLIMTGIVTWFFKPTNS